MMYTDTVFSVYILVLTVYVRMAFVYCAVSSRLKTVAVVVVMTRVCRVLVLHRPTASVVCLTTTYTPGAVFTPVHRGSTP